MGVALKLRVLGVLRVLRGKVMSAERRARSYSTFGQVSAAMGAHLPYMVNWHGVCARELTAEPCFHKA
jgi:hypothetical protein